MTDLVPGVWLEDWILGESLGKGGFAQVFRARREPDGDAVAIKVGDLEHLRREAGAAGLDHPHVLRIRQARLEHDPPFLVLDLIEGHSLREELERGPCAPRRVLGWIQALSQGLDHAHERGVLHLDLKPENVLIGADGAARLCDFGAATPRDAESLRQSIALSEASLDRAGTPDYAAPELRAGDDLVDRRADVYGLGVLTFELLTGSLPLGLDRPSVLCPQLPGSVDAVLERALARDPGRRPLSAGAFARELGLALGAAPPPDQVARPPARARVTLVGLALACALSGLAYATARLPSTGDPTPSPLGERVGALLADRAAARVAVLPTLDLDGPHGTRASGLSHALSQALPRRGPLLKADGAQLFERSLRDQLVRESGCQLAIQAVIPPDAADAQAACLLFLVELRPYRVISAHDPKPGPARELASALLSRLPPGTRGALAVLPSRELPAGASNAEGAAFDAALVAALGEARPEGLEVRAWPGTIERLRAFAGDTRGALSAGLGVEVALDPARSEVRGELVQLDGRHVLARASTPWTPNAGHDPQRGANRFTLDPLALRRLDGELGRALEQALAEAHAHLEAARPRAALALLVRLSQGDPALAEDAGLLLALSRTYRELGEPWRALEACRRALARSPDLPAAHAELAQAALAEADRLFTRGKATRWWLDDDEEACSRAWKGSCDASPSEGRAPRLAPASRVRGGVHLRRLPLRGGHGIPLAGGAGRGALLRLRRSLHAPRPRRAALARRLEPPRVLALVAGEALRPRAQTRAGPRRRGDRRAGRRPGVVAGTSRLEKFLTNRFLAGLARSVLLRWVSLHCRPKVSPHKRTKRTVSSGGEGI
jgi:tetratricopeptide (TPR) repeat protein